MHQRHSEMTGLGTVSVSVRGNTLMKMDDASIRGVAIGLIILTFVLVVGVCCEVLLGL